MILHDFKCEFCGEEIEILIKKDEKTPNCPVCGHLMTKLISTTHFVLKGSNWAKDNYGLKGNKKK
ncbi:MAG: FmdB family zinc ribbon protein [Patescibacteria group bacterium]|nr:FmdB family zinc ribbon protein [Patescibacteria group bacterium]